MFRKTKDFGKYSKIGMCWITNPSKESCKRFTNGYYICHLLGKRNTKLNFKSSKFLKSPLKTFLDITDFFIFSKVLLSESFIHTFVKNFLHIILRKCFSNFQHSEMKDIIRICARKKREKSNKRHSSEIAFANSLLGIWRFEIQFQNRIML